MLKKALLGLFLILVIGIGGAAVVFRNIGGDDIMYQPTGLNDTFPDVKTFDEYIQKSQKMIREARKKVGLTFSDGKTEDFVVRKNAPFELKPQELAVDQKGKTAKYRNGILIAHGLNRSPREMKSIADYFSKLGFLVRVTLMPGHGTVLGDLGRVQAEEWMKMYTFGMESFKGEVDNLYLMGFSTGGLLACIHALDHKKMEENNVRGLILISPALEIKLKSAALLPYIFSIMDKFPLLSFPNRLDKIDNHGYESPSLNAGYQIYRLIQKLKEGRKTSEINLPIFTATTMEDLIVDVPAVKEYLYNLPNEDNEHMIYTAEPIKLPKVKGIVEQVNSSQQAWGGRVVGFSHSAMHVSPEDFHYGRFSKFRPCGHYSKESPLYNACRHGNEDLDDEHRSCGRYHDNPEKLKACMDTKAFVGEASSENLKKYKPLQRLMYNNKFKYMFRVLDRYLYKTGALDARRYQLREYKRTSDINQKQDSITEKLKNEYGNRDLTGALEDVSVDLDLSSVDFVKFDKTNIEDFSALSQLLELTHLSINDNGDVTQGDLVEDFSVLGELKNLNVLQLKNVPCKDITSLKKLTKLSLVVLIDTYFIPKTQIDELRKALPNTEIVFSSSLDVYSENLENFKGDISSFFKDYRANNENAVDNINTLFLHGVNVESLEEVAKLKSLEDIRFDGTSVPSPEVFSVLKSIDLKEVKFFNLDPKEAEKFKILVQQIEKDHPNVTITVDFRHLIEDRLKANGGDLTDALKDLIEPFNLKKYMVLLILPQTAVSDLTPIANFTNLESIDIEGTQVSDLSPLEKLSKLKYLTISNTKITSLQGVEGKQALDSIDFSNTKVGDLEPLKDCVNLTEIRSSNTQVASLLPLAHFPRLAFMLADGTQIHDLKGLEDLKKLKTFSARNTKVRDLGPLKNLSLTLGVFDQTLVEDISPLIDSKNIGLTFAFTPFGDAAYELGGL